MGSPEACAGHLLACRRMAGLAGCTSCYGCWRAGVPGCYPLPVARCPLPAAAAAGAAACVLHGPRRTTRPRRVHMMLACPDVSAPSALRAGERYCM